MADGLGAVCLGGDPVEEAERLTSLVEAPERAASRSGRR
jgi:hypothetical protein